MISETISHYRIVQKLGAGGMGEVYLAEDTKLDRRVAVKFLSIESATDEGAKKRLIREARAAAKLDHPNICSIYEVAEENGRSFIVMQYVDGETLANRIQRKPLELKESLDIATQIADALAEAHSRGIVHRDIKPQNVMFTARGQAKVLDFGLAKTVQQKSLTDSAAETKSLMTEPGMIIGTVPYMSPEQVRGESLDARSDIFSFGAVVYEMVSGHQPFAAENAAATISTILTKEPPPLARYSRQVPSELERIVSKALRKDREPRYQTARDLVIDLKSLSEELAFKAKLGTSTSARSIGESESVTNNEQTIETAPQPTATTTEVGTTVSVSSKGFKTGVRRHRFQFAAVVLVLIALAGVGIYLASGHRKTIDSLAVLPFTNVSGDPNTEYLSDGISESLINKLSQLPNLTVMSRNSVFRYKGQEIDAQAAGRDLKVQAVLTGRMVQRGGSLSISAEFVDVRNNSHIWGEQYNRRLSDIFAVQEEIARQISETLSFKLSGEDRKRLTKHYTDNTEAYQLYLKGRYYWNKRSAEGTSKAIEYFKQAIDADPNYALAYAGLADSYGFLTEFSGVPKEETYPKAMAAARKALELDDTLSEAHTSLAANLQADMDWSGAEREFKRAIELNPNYPTAHHWYSEYLQIMGRLDESQAEIKRALELDPLSLAINAKLGLTLYFARDYDHAIEQLRKTLEMDPNFHLAHIFIDLAYVQKGSYEEAITEKAKLLAAASAEEAQIATALRKAYATSGERGLWFKTLDLLKQKPRTDFDVPFRLAEAYLHLGDKDQAFEWFQKAADLGHPGMDVIKLDPMFDSLRSDPRFPDLMRRVGLAQ